MRIRSKRRHTEGERPVKSPSLNGPQQQSVPNSAGPLGQTLLRVQRLAGNAAAARIAQAGVRRQPDVAEQPEETKTRAGWRMTVSGVGTFDVLSASLSTNSGGGGRGAPQLREIVVTKEQDEHSPELQLLAVKGTVIDSVQLATRTFTIEGKDVYVTSFQLGGSGDRPIDSLTLNAAAPGFTFQQEKAKGP